MASPGYGNLHDYHFHRLLETATPCHICNSAYPPLPSTPATGPAVTRAGSPGSITQALASGLAAILFLFHFRKESYS